MSFSIGNFLREELQHEDLKIFVKGKLPYSNRRKEEIFESIENEINKDSGILTEEEFNLFVRNIIKYGKRRFLFIAHFSPNDGRRLKSPRNLSSSLRSLLSRPTTEDFDELNDSSNHVLDQQDLRRKNFKFEYLSKNYEEDDLVSIELCITYINRITIDNSDGTTSYNYSKEYNWVEINLKKNYLVVRLHPVAGEIYGKDSSARKQYSEVLNLLKRNLLITTLDMTHFKETFYNIFKDITDISEKPFREEVEKKSSILTNSIDEITSSGIFSTDFSRSSFEERVIDLVERVLISERYLEYVGYSEGKYAILNKMQFTDSTGASVNASAGSKQEDTLELSDVFFDTRKTIEKEKSLNTLWIDWFYTEESATTETISSPIKISTKFDSTSEFYLVHFRNIKLTKEVEDLVFSKIATYSGVRWD